MKHIKISLFLLLFVFFAIGSIAQNQNVQSNIDSLKRRVVEVEKKLSSGEKELEDLHFKLNLIHGIATNAEDTALKTNRELFKEEFGWFIGALTLLGFFIGWFGLRKYIEGRAIVHIDKFLESEKWTKALKIKIHKQLAENKLKDEVNVLVISNDDDTDKVVKNYFRENGFNPDKIKYKKGTEVNFNDDDFDILFINNIGNTFTLPDRNSNQTSTILDSLIEKIKTDYNSLAVFYFNDSGIKLPDNLDKGLNSSFANSLASLYHNLLDLMRYKYVVLDNKKLDNL